MATYKGDVATAVAAGGLSNKVLKGLIDGRVKCMLDSITLAGTELSGSLIYLGSLLPAGANVIAIVLSVSVAQASLTFQLGDVASGTRYISSANSGLQTALLPVLASGINYVVGTATNDNQIMLTTGGATATAGVLKAAILYSQD